jgi:hypothetical protein
VSRAKRGRDRVLRGALAAAKVCGTDWARRTLQVPVERMRVARRAQAATSTCVRSSRPNRADAVDDVLHGERRKQHAKEPR